jgi:CheY-like chemotaxis protein
VVSNGAEALKYLTGEGRYADRDEYPMPRVILLDLKMPEIDGFELLKRLKAMPTMGDVLIIAVSALDDLESIRRAYGLGARSFLAKPCQAVDVENLIQGFPGHWSRTPGA